MSNILEGLNREQKEAVLQNKGTVLVLAGAGCGKTKVLTTRIAHLVQSGVSPYEILAVTFTNKAAKEMVERLSKMVGEEKAKKMWIGTFHSISGRILRTDIQEYVDENGKSYDNKFVIYDDTDSNAILKNALKVCNLDEKIYQPKLLKTIISNAKNKMQDAYTFATRARDYRTEKYTKTVTKKDKDGNVTKKKVSRKRLIVEVTTKTKAEVNDEYDFTESELKQIEELLSEEYDELWDNLIG